MHRLAQLAILVAATTLVVGCSEDPDDNDDENDEPSDKYMVTATAGDGGSISPEAVEVPEGETALFNLSADSDHSLESVEGCDGELDGMTYTTGPITENCEVEASFIAADPETHHVDTIAGEGGSITPESMDVPDGDTGEFAVSPDVGWFIDEVTGCDGDLEGTTYTTGEITEPCTVEAIFESDGSEVPEPSVDWTFDAGAGVAGVTYHDGSLFAATGDGELFELDTETGDDGWDFSTDAGFTNRPVADDDHVYSATADGDVYAVDRTDGTESWHHDTEETIHGSVAVDDQNVYALTASGHLHAMAADDGDHRWDVEIDGPSSLLTSPVAYDLHAYVAVEDETWAYEDTAGFDQWDREIGREDVSPAAGDGLVFTADDDSLHGLDSNDGTDEWDEDLDETPFGAVAFADPSGQDSLVAVAGLEGSLFAFDAAGDGDLWTFDPEQTRFTNDPTIDDGAMVFATYTVPDDHQDVNYDVEETGLVAVDNGEQAWHLTVDDEVDQSAPAVTDDRVFFGTDDNGSGTVYAIERP